MQVKLPRGVGVANIAMHRSRAEFSLVEIRYYDPDMKKWITDGFASVAQEVNTVPYKMKDPGKFKPKTPRDELGIELIGTWLWGDAHISQRMSDEIRWYRDRVDVTYWTGSSEPANSSISLYFDKKMSDLKFDDNGKLEFV